MSFSAMKKSRQAELEKLKEALEKQGNPNTESDNFWKPERDKAGNGQAIIRFLPAAEGEGAPWITYYDHWFKGPTGQYYVEKSLTTIGKEDPVSEYNTKLWNSGVEDDKQIARAQKRRLHHVANIYVVKDYSNPENNGKVFQYRFGKKIFDKLKEAMNPTFDGDEAFNPFDFWEGANFHIRITEVEGWANYDKSVFQAPAPLFDGDDEKLKELYESLLPLSSMISPDKFKSYDELKAKLDRVLAIESDEPTKPAREMKTVPASPINTVTEDDDDSDDDTPISGDALSYFQSLTSED